MNGRILKKLRAAFIKKFNREPTHDEMSLLKNIYKKHDAVYECKKQFTLS